MSVRHQAQFTIIYDGEALRDSRMDVRDLAPALLAFGDLLEQANRVINGDRASVTVHVRAFQAGCFGITFEMMQSYAETIRNFLAPGTSVRDSLEILSLLGITPVSIGVGLLCLVRKAKGKKPSNMKKLENGHVLLEFEGTEEDSVEVSPEVVELYKDARVRDALDKGMEPLRREGIESFGMKNSTGERVTLVSSKEAAYFRMPAIEDTPLSLNEIPQERILSIVSLSFKEDNKWRLSDGSAVFNVKICDTAFLNKVNNGLTFAKGDMLRVMLVISASYTKDGLKTEYTATKILEHIKIPRQLWLE